MHGRDCTASKKLYLIMFSCLERGRIIYIAVAFQLLILYFFSMTWMQNKCIQQKKDKVFK